MLEVYEVKIECEADILVKSWFKKERIETFKIRQVCLPEFLGIAESEEEAIEKACKKMEGEFVGRVLTKSTYLDDNFPMNFKAEHLKEFRIFNQRAEKVKISLKRLFSEFDAELVLKYINQRVDCPVKDIYLLAGEKSE